MVQVMFLLKFPKGVVCGCKNTCFSFSRSTANKQEKIILCLKEIGSFILNINHPETFPFFVLNSQGGCQQTCQVEARSKELCSRDNLMAE